MASSDRVRTRAQRVASRVDYNGFRKRCKDLLYTNFGWQKLSLLILLALVLSTLSAAWDPPFTWRLYSKPDRNVICNTNFSEIDITQTNAKREGARQTVAPYYINDPEKIESYKSELVKEMSVMLNTRDLSKQATNRRLLRQYLPEKSKAGMKELENVLSVFREYFGEDVDLANYKSQLNMIFDEYAKTGALYTDNEGARDRSPTVKIYGVAHERELLDDRSRDRRNDLEDSYNPEEFDRKYEVVERDRSTVEIGRGEALRERLSQVFPNDSALAGCLFARFLRNPPSSLSEDTDSTLRAQEYALKAVEPVVLPFRKGEILVHANETVDENRYNWLRSERRAYLKTSRRVGERVTRWFATFGLFATMLCSTYLFMSLRRRGDGPAICERSLKSTAIYLFFFACFFAVCRILQVAWPNQGRLTEMIPALVFVQLTTFATSWTFAISVGLIFSFALMTSSGAGFDCFIVFFGVSIFVAFMSRNVKTRLQLVFLSIGAGVFATILSTTAGLLTNDYMRPRDSYEPLFLLDVAQIVALSGYRGLWAFLAGVLTMCLLPIAEQYFQVATPMLLLEYANPSHPLMLELSRRAPATYNHSIQTSTLAEAAAEAIGARAYLAKVGAYFHDVGKMLNPEYFTENQGDRNIHDELEPRVSALVIVAHEKDGVDLGRRYSLPREIIDLIEQHHGTMLVGFFYKNALKAAQESDPDAKLDEAPFRYPGPIPQSKEAGILMLADAAESASRSLVDWSPRRVESLVRKLTETRIEDGQFRDSGLTFGEIQIIQQSLVTSLLASRHTRVKYDDDKDKDKDKEKEKSKENDQRGGSTVREESKIIKRDAHDRDASSSRVIRF